MEYRELGNTREKISAIGLGCMGMNHGYGVADDQESIATLHRALDLGITFWDTADIYAAGKNEELVSKVLVPNRKKVFIATKFGFKNLAWGASSGREAGRGADASDSGPASLPGRPGTDFDGSPAYMRTAVERSLKRLGIEVIDLYYAHRIDPNVPVEEMVGAMSELVKEGKVRYLGLSEASAASLRTACTVHPIAALQSEYSILTRDLEAEILPTCRELGISLVPFSPLSRGLITNTLDVKTLGEKDFRKSLPRFHEANLQNNEGLAHAFAALAETKGCTAAQLALAWVLAQGKDIIPIPGTKRRKYLEENARSVDIALSEQDLLDVQEVLKAFPDTGSRYGEEAMRMVNR